MRWNRQAVGPTLRTGVSPAVIPSTGLERVGSMDAIMNFLGNTYVMVGMGVALVALIGIMIFLRMKPRDED
jgi:hypothetical protein